MKSRWTPRELAAPFLHVLKWLLIVAPMAAAVGSACALFLWSLERATEARWAHPWLLFLLPAAGVLIALLYQRVGRSAEGGHDLIMEQIHEPGGGVPRRMAPLILLSTVTTHLFGGSAGREGTAIQMGGSIASAFVKPLGLKAADARTLLMAGMAAGFGGVFGTPVAGAVFALEVPSSGRMSYEALAPCLAAALIADGVCGAWGVGHTDYHRFLAFSGSLEWTLMLKVLVAAAAFGLAGLFFSELLHGARGLFKRLVPSPLLRPLAGAAVVIGLVYVLGTRDYLGLGVRAAAGDDGAVTILSSFHGGGAGWGSWFWKSVFTAATLGSGFKGGEVTPLFFIGSTLGNVLARLLSAPADLFAALGFVAVFAGAANTPLACAVMGVELFGAGPAVYFAEACFFAYLFSGRAAIYASQRAGAPKA